MNSTLDRELENDLGKTKAKDDIEILLNIIDQLGDRLSEAADALQENEVDGYDEDTIEDLKCVVCQVPRSDCHCKYWTDYGYGELAEAIRRKYANAKGMKIPEEYMTSF